MVMALTMMMVIFFQVDKLLKAAQMAVDSAGAGGKAAGKTANGLAGAAAANGGGVEFDDDDDDDELRYRPQLNQLVPKAGTVGGGGDAAGRPGSGLATGNDGIYRPPRFNPVAMDDDVDGGLSSRDKRRLKEASRRAKSSDLVQELAQELMGAPEEIRDQSTGAPQPPHSHMYGYFEASGAILCPVTYIPNYVSACVGCCT